MEDLKKLEETLRIDKVTPEENRNFVDIAAEIYEHLNDLEILRDEYFRAMPQLKKKMKDEKLKTALHFLVLLKTQVASMTIGLKDNSEYMDEESDGDEENSDNEISDEDKFTDKEQMMLMMMMIMKAIMKRMLKILKRKVGKHEQVKLIYL